MKRILPFLLCCISFSACEKNFKGDSGSFTDERNGQVYNWIKIDDQIWMAENLNYQPANGSWAYEDDPSYAAIYGRLYDWETACNICPDGWHLPKMTEFEELIYYLGGHGSAGNKMKTSDTIYWDPPNEGATNESGFSALPGGAYEPYSANKYKSMGKAACFWSARPDPENENVKALYFSLSYYFPHVQSRYISVKTGISVRCIQD